MATEISSHRGKIPPPRRQATPAWERRYANKIILTDILVVICAVYTAQYFRFGLAAEELQIPLAGRYDFGITYTLVSVSLVLAWLAGLTIWETRRPVVFGTGPTEYKRVAQATILVFGTYAIIAFLLKAQIGRGYLMIALPLGLLLLMLSRWLWRKRLHQQRGRGVNSYRTLIAGEARKLVHVAREIQRSKTSGFHIIGAATDGAGNGEVLPGLPIVAGYDGIIEAVDAYRVDTLIITSTDEVSPQQLREIGWELEARRVNLIVTAALTDIAGPRIHMRPVSGLPLIHVAYPEFSGRKFFLKRMFDLGLSFVGLMILSPVLLILALVVKLSSPGPVIFRQQRIGHAGVPFNMLKFRSMVADAEDQLPGLLDQSENEGVLFKIKDDPRITRSGAWMRKFSMDELPQLVNVFLGQMSLVGPRPPLPSEVDQYERWVHRRLLVKPGITGLWQVSGRSDLSWDDSIRLDLYYVENWSLVGDIILLWRTVKTVVRSEGAY